MCLIIASPDGKKPADSVFEDANNSNSHGAGLAWIDEDAKKIRFKKGLDIEEFLKLFKTISGPWIAHFRIASVGGVTEKLTHPFIISEETPLDLEGTADQVLFHNGTVYKWEEEMKLASGVSRVPIPDGEMSDSRATAFCVAIYGKNYLRYVSNGSRFIIFSYASISKKKKTNMFMTGSWDEHKESGLFCSNRGCSLFNPKVISRPTPAVGPTKGATADDVTGQATRITTDTSSRPYTGGGRSIDRRPGGPLCTRVGRFFRERSGINPWTDFDQNGKPDETGLESVGAKLTDLVSRQP